MFREDGLFLPIRIDPRLICLLVNITVNVLDLEAQTFNFPSSRQLKTANRAKNHVKKIRFATGQTEYY